MRSLTVAGHGLVTAPADAADVRVAVVHQAPSVAAAVAGVDEAGRQARAVAVETVAESGLSQTDFSVWPRHDNEGRPSGFEARHSLTIRCPDLAVAGRLVTALADRLGNRLVVEQLTPVIADRRPLEDQARVAAFEDAQRRADELAALAGDRLGWVVSVVEGGTGEPAPMAEAAAAKLDLDLSFADSHLTVSTRLTVTFRLGE